MAYSAPSTVSTGDLCTASIWNADVVANAIALHAGAMAVTSQAVGDLLYASSTTQFARIAAVATGQVLTSAGTGTVPAWSSNVDLGGTLDVTGRLLVDSAGPSALGQAVSGTTGLVLGGAFTSDGSSNYAYKVNIAGALTGASGDTARLALFRVGGTGITTHATSETTTLVTSAYIAEPSLTKGSGSTVTNATALYIDAAPSGATNNYAIWVDAGATQLDGTLDVGGATTLDSTLTVVNDVAVDTDTLFVDVSADNVGIGVTDPDVALDVSGGDNVLDIFRITQRVSGAAAYGLQVGLADTGDPVFQRLVNDTATESFRIVRGTGVVKFNANVGIGTTTPTSPSGVNRILEIEDGTHAGLVLHDSTADAWEIYANSTDISFAYNNSVKTRIEGDTGQVGIGTASPGARLEIEDGGISHPGPLLIVRQDTDDVWNTVLCNDAYSATALHGCRMTVGTGGDFALYAPDKGSSPGDIKFYTDEAERVAILAAGGMTFNGDTAAANALDDYEEGSWSPVPQGSSGSLGSGAHNMNGTYTKVGRLCVATCYGYFTNLGSWSGDLQITGLPFTHGVGQVTQGTIGQFPFGTPEDDEVWITVMFPAGGTHMNFRQGYNMDVVVPFSIVHGTGMAFSITVSFYV